MAAMLMLRFLYVVGGLLFLVSAVAHMYVRVRLRPRDDSGLDNCYHEFEEQHPEYARYTKWLHITLAGAALGILLLFLVSVF